MRSCERDSGGSTMPCPIEHARDVAYDKYRDRCLIAQGFTVLRFWNNDVFDNFNGVMYRIADALTRSLDSDRP